MLEQIGFDLVFSPPPPSNTPSQVAFWGGKRWLLSPYSNGHRGTEQVGGVQQEQAGGHPVPRHASQHQVGPVFL
jgi:hypothetical protein